MKITNKIKIGTEINIEINDIDPSKYMQLIKIFVSNKKIKGWLIINISKLKGRRIDGYMKHSFSLTAIKTN